MARLRIVEVIPFLARAGVMLGFFLACPGWTQAASPVAIATPPQPGWSKLSIPQKIVLAPLADEWDSLASFSRRKWLEFAVRFPLLSPEEQRRAQGQMWKWRKLTPEERQAARENYQFALRLSTGQRQELKQKWEKYSSLSGEEKEKFKQRAAGKPAQILARAASAACGARSTDEKPSPLWRPGASIPYRVSPPARWPR
ncbi:MAG: DUF3106 domain-containing protein [Candidatus Accumulibacter sp.]|jgi:hypothetical protein|nr:DUF3106 domain-containing protein [Accumulibacter sp.]